MTAFRSGAVAGFAFASTRPRPTRRAADGQLLRAARDDARRQLDSARNGAELWCPRSVDPADAADIAEEAWRKANPGLAALVDSPEV